MARDNPWVGVEEMIVSGESSAVLLQQQEVSAISFDADYLEALGASDLSDISQFTPNLEIRTPFAASNPTLFIRGVGLRDFNANSSSSVAVYNDEVYMNSPAGQLSQLFDVETIDVLRGPQATQYARNASAGTIRVVARKPTGSPEASFDVTYGRFNESNFSGAIENVIIPEHLSMRSSFRVNRRDGITKNRCADPSFNQNPGLLRRDSFKQRVFEACFNPQNTSEEVIAIGGEGWREGEIPPVRDWVNDVNNWGARTIIRYQETIAGVGVDLMLNLHGGQNRGDSRQFQIVGATQLLQEVTPRADIPLDANGYTDPDNQRRAPGSNVFSKITSPFDGDPFQGDYNNVEKEKLDLFGANIVAVLDWGDFQLTSVTAYEQNERDVELNLDGNPYRALEPVLTNETYQVSQELRLDWDDGEALSGQVGAMYLYEGLSVLNEFSIELVRPGTNQRYTFFTRYAAGWLNSAWRLSESFKVEGGFRFNYEEKELNLQSELFRIGTGQAIPGRPNRFAASAAKEAGWAADLKFTYAPVEDISFYGRYARGWKGPHINGGVVNPNARTSSNETLTTPVVPERIDAVELGMKSQFWDARVRMNWALFYYDYQDIQVFQLKNAGAVPVQQLINADDADVLGFEAELDIKPFEGWGPLLLDSLWIHTTFAWLDSKYTDFVNVQTVSVALGADVGERTISEDLTGNRLINSPEFAFIGFVAWPLGGSWGQVIPRLDWSFKDEVFFSPANSNLLNQDPLWLLNFRLTYRDPSQHFTLSGWVENLTDQAYSLDVFNLARTRRSIVHAVGDPRTYGLTLSFSF
ncbi:MAG: TonB-dependent receptor [Myxococcota bacterium]